MTSLTDHGPKPYVLDIEAATLENPNFRSTLWTGTHLQLTVMSIPVGESIGLEVHHDTDQFIRVEQGTGRVEMGHTETEVIYHHEVGVNSVIFVPAETWHNVINTGDTELKVYTLYGPAHHPHGTVHPTKWDAEHDPAEQ